MVCPCAFERSNIELDHDLNDESGAISGASVLHFKFSREQRNAAKDVPTEQSPPRKNTWISGADENPRGTARAEGQAR